MALSIEAASLIRRKFDPSALARFWRMFTALMVISLRPGVSTTGPVKFLAVAFQAPNVLRLSVKTWRSSQVGRFEAAKSPRARLLSSSCSREAFVVANW